MNGSGERCSHFFLLAETIADGKGARQRATLRSMVMV